MSISVVIESKGLFKKELPFEDIVYGSIGYGAADQEYVLDENQIGDVTIIYDKNHICRGYDINVQKGLVRMNLPIPTSERDIRFFYDAVRRVCNRFKTNEFYKLNDDVGFNYSLNDIEKCISDDIKVSTDSLNSYEELTVFGVYNPICLDENDLREINGDINKFGEYMHHLQSMDAYFAKTNLFRKSDDTLFGVYFIKSGVKTILPYKPFVPFNDDMEVSEWYIDLGLNEEESGTIPYSVFLNNIDIIGKYDKKHFITKVDSDTLKSLVDRYNVDL